MNKNLRLSWPLFFALLYFFVNSIFLPEGLLYTAILTPILLWWLYRQGEWKWLGYFFIFTVPFIPFHFREGVGIFYYARSYLLFFSSWVFGLCFYVYLKKATDLSLIFRQLLILNFLLIPIALAALLLPQLKGAFWYLKEISPGVGSFPRLKMFTYEASYYSFLLVPLCVYFYLRLLFYRERRALWILLITTLPLILSFSLGVAGGMIISFACMVCFYPRPFFRLKGFTRGITVTFAGTAFFLVCILILYPHNILFERAGNILHGKDTSFRGRTYESFILAWKIMKTKSIWFGCGPGQVKVAGIPVFRQYYGYLSPVIRIPNTLADTLATYGILGLAARLVFTVYFFFRTRVYDNYYRLWLFIFLFIYQFTGSFLTNIAEYVIWVLIFTECFPEFDRSNLARPVSEINCRPYGNCEIA